MDSVKKMDLIEFAWVKGENERKSWRTAASLSWSDSI